MKEIRILSLKSILIVLIEHESHRDQEMHLCRYVSYCGSAIIVSITRYRVMERGCQKDKLYRHFDEERGEAYG